MKTLALITHVRDLFLAEKGKYFKQMMSSVSPQLGQHGDFLVTHHVLECRDSSSHSRIRYDSRSLGDYIAFIDDDDVLLPDAIKTCVEVLSLQPDIGVVFTKQQLINQDGFVLNSLNIDRPLVYKDVISSIQTIHHFAVMRSSAIPTSHIDKLCSSGSNIGLEWLMKAGCALSKGAVYIPEAFYSWRHHQGFVHGHCGHELMRAEASLKECLKTIFHDANHTYYLSSQIPVYSRQV